MVSVSTIATKANRNVSATCERAREPDQGASCGLRESGAEHRPTERQPAAEEQHPELERILAATVAAGGRAAVSSIRIPAGSEAVLAALRASGGRSLTLAPETGTDLLRWLMNKPVPSSLLIEKVGAAFRHGFRELKLYFIVGLPGETDEDFAGIVELAAACRGAMLEATRATGTAGEIHLGVNLFVPKPFTPWQREPMAPEALLRRRIDLLRRGIAGLPNVRLDANLSPRQAVWQTWLSRGGSKTLGHRDVAGVQKASLEGFGLWVEGAKQAAEDDLGALGRYGGLARNCQLWGSGWGGWALGHWGPKGL